MTTNLRILSILAILALMPLEAPGQAPAAFSRIGFGARGIGLSNALVADAMGDGSPYYNPALAPFATGQSLEASAAVLSFDRRLQFLQFATPIRPSAGVAAGLIHASVSDIDGRDDSGYHTESYSVDEFAFFLFFGTRIGEKVTAGIGLQLFRADYFDELKPVNSIGIDAGITYSVFENLRLGLAVDDFLARYSWDTSDLYGSGGKTTSDRFPVRLRVGAAYRLMEGKAQLLAEYESSVTSYEYRTREVVLIGDNPQEETASKRARIQENRARVGVEYQLSDIFTVRGGIDRIGAGTLEGVTPSAGFMIEQPVGPLVARAEYAFVLEPYNVGAMHLITLRIFL